MIIIIEFRFVMFYLHFLRVQIVYEYSFLVSATVMSSAALRIVVMRVMPVMPIVVMAVVPVLMVLTMMFMLMVMSEIRNHTLHTRLENQSTNTERRRASDKRMPQSESMCQNRRAHDMSDMCDVV